WRRALDDDRLRLDVRSFRLLERDTRHRERNARHFDEQPDADLRRRVEEIRRACADLPFDVLENTLERSSLEALLAEKRYVVEESPTVGRVLEESPHRRELVREHRSLARTTTAAESTPAQVRVPREEMPLARWREVDIGVLPSSETIGVPV